MNKITQEQIDSLSYTDFVAFVNQTNVPPGSYSTLTKWRVNSGIDTNSNIFEAACTTGFSIINLAKSANCGGVGVDIHQQSVEKARLNAKNAGLDTKIDFACLDASTYKAETQFTHIVLGAALGFFADPMQMLNNIRSMVGEIAFILAAPFYAVKEVPQDVVRKAQQVLDITPTIHGYKDIMRLYNGFIVDFEDRQESVPETDSEIQHYCTSTITRACKELNINDSESYDKLYARLYAIKQICNELRQYQRYSVLVLKYDKAMYPNRYVEIF